MRTRIFIIAGMMLLAGAATEPSTRPAEPVSSLIADLSSPDFGVRELAEKQLSDLGPSIEPVLRDALRGNVSDETRARLGHVLEQLDQCKNLHASITMHYVNAPLTRVVKDFACQAGADLGIADPALAPYLNEHTATLDLDNADFWTAMKELNAAAGLDPCIGPKGLTLSPDDSINSGVAIPFPTPEAHVFGGLLIMPMPLLENRTESAGESTISVGIHVYPEPKLHVVGIIRTDWVQECVDDMGQSLSPINMIPRMPIVIERGRQWHWEPSLIFREGNSSATAISRLKGKLDFFVQTRGEVLEIPNITRARNVTKSDADISLTVLSCSRRGRSYTISIRMRGMTTRDPAFRDFISGVELVDNLGQPIPRQSVQSVQGADGINVNAMFAPTDLMPDKLRWDRTLEQKRLTVPFELDDLTLSIVR